MIDGVHFKATLPLRWQVEYSATVLENARYLTVLAEFEQRENDRSKEQTDLHAKLDLVLLWLARAQLGEMPPTSAVLLGQEQLSWLSATPLDVANGGTVVLNLSDALPFLLQLSAEVLSCTAEGEQWRINVQLQLGDENLRDAWERTVFRRHRRAIQQECGART